jgi:hypothetical protein
MHGWSYQQKDRVAWQTIQNLQLSEAMEELPERWWFRHDENDALLKRFTKHESKAQMQVCCPLTLKSLGQQAPNSQIQCRGYREDCNRESVVQLKIPAIQFQSSGSSGSISRW